jgi:hypothetical protein
MCREHVAHSLPNCSAQFTQLDMRRRKSYFLLPFCPNLALSIAFLEALDGTKAAWAPLDRQDLAMSTGAHIPWIGIEGGRGFNFLIWALFRLCLEDSHSPSHLGGSHDHDVACVYPLRDQNFVMIENLLIVFDIVR